MVSAHRMGDCEVDIPVFAFGKNSYILTGNSLQPPIHGSDRQNEPVYGLFCIACKCPECMQNDPTQQNP